MRSITNTTFSCKAGKGGWSREARIENPRSLAEVEATSDSVERSTEGWSLKMTCSRGGCIPCQQKEDPGATRRGLRKSPDSFLGAGR
jgi:hypothetical protein